MTLTRRTALRGLGATATAGLIPGLARADEAETAHHLRELFVRSKIRFDQGIQYLSRRGGEDLISPLIFAMRYTQYSQRPIADLLTRITGDYVPTDWFSWMKWQERHPEIVPHPALIELKREVYLSLDPEFSVFLRPEFLERNKMGIRLEEVTWGGVRKDGIPSLDNPILVEAGDDAASYLNDTDLVFGVSIEGDQRAYPLRILGWHEMFNDRIGGVPVALAYCTLCGSGILFETDVFGEEAVFSMGSSGFLYRSNKLMYDRQTNSLWNQFTGKPVIGPLASSGITLKERPVAIEPWGTWRRRNPRTRVLSRRTGYQRDYGAGVVYREYFASPDLMFPTNTDETRLAQKDYVFGIRSFRAAKAWPIRAFEGGRILNDRVGDLNVVLIGEAAGRTVRAYDRGALEFSEGASARDLRASGDAWTITEDALVGPGGQTRARVAGHVAYWFAWDGYLAERSELFEG